MTEKSIQETYAPNLKCFGCGPANERGLHIRSFPSGEEVIADWQPESYQEAFPGMLPLQLDRRVPFDEAERSRSSTLHRHG